MLPVLFGMGVAAFGIGKLYAAEQLLPAGVGHRPGCVFRCGIKYRLRFFVFLNDALKIPILQHHVLQPAGGLPDLMKELADFFTRNGLIGKEEFIAEKRSIFLL